VFSLGPKCTSMRGKNPIAATAALTGP